jgi:hypothetical protein
VRHTECGHCAVLDGVCCCCNRLHDRAKLCSGVAETQLRELGNEAPFLRLVKAQLDADGAAERAVLSACGVAMFTPLLAALARDLSELTDGYGVDVFVFLDGWVTPDVKAAEVRKRRT